jgi:putative MATE family efflux protein
LAVEASEGTYTAAPELIDESNLLRSVIRLAWPVVVQQVSFSMVQLVDTALVGHLGEDALAGVRLAGQLFWFSQAGIIAVGIGSTAIIARAVGAGEKDKASRVLQTAFAMALAWGVLMGLAMFFLGERVLGFLGAEPAARHDGGLYMRYAAMGMPFMSLLFAGNAAQQGAGDTRTPMVVGLIINVVNVIVAYAFINGELGAPELGVKGSGLGFAVSAVVGCALVLLALASGARTLKWSPTNRLDGEAARRVLNVGVPAGVEQMQFNIAFLTYTAIIASLGTTALAAHGVTLAIQSLTFNVGFALGVATTALVGQSLGAGRPDLAEKSAYLTMRYSLVFMCALGLLLMIFGGQITSLFVGGKDADEVVHIGRQLMFIFAFAMPGVAVSLSLGGALRGAGDTRAVLIIMVFSTWVVRLVPAYILAVPLGLGVPGAWLMAVVDITTRAALMFGRFRMGRWKTIRV